MSMHPPITPSLTVPPAGVTLPPQPQQPSFSKFKESQAAEVLKEIVPPLKEAVASLKEIIRISKPRVKKGFSYKFSASWGPFLVTCRGNYEKDLKDLDRLLAYLDKPQTKHVQGVAASIKSLQMKVVVRLARFWNLLFGDHEWYNEKRARKFIKHYIHGTAYQDKTERQREKVLKIYDRLSSLQHAKGNWAHGMDRNALLEKSWIDLEHLGYIAQRIGENPLIRLMAKIVMNKCISSSERWAIAKAAGLLADSAAPFSLFKWADLAALLISGVAAEFKFKAPTSPAPPSDKKDPQASV